MGVRPNERLERLGEYRFRFRDAHELDSMTARALGEEYVKKQLRQRLGESAAAIVLIGEKTKNLHKFVRWELDLALELGLR